ncbi:MAG: hypothetical protein KKC14_11390 [Alphaproteobacteria bacterium]|nr:hypothetical protein [Alphaproteobacteria bacterium]
MTALACLKIFVGEELRFTDPDSLAALVAKVAGAYLETTWLWPRRHGLVAPFSFVLTDPRAVKLDPRELQALARDLQHKLFGDKGVGEIALLTFEGDQSEVMRFAGIPPAQLKALLNGEDDGTFEGRICRITPTGITSVAPAGGPVVGEPPMEVLAATPSCPAPARVGYRGVFHTQRQIFLGNVAVWRAAELRRDYGLDEPALDVHEIDHDIPILEAARGEITRFGAGIMFLPINFSAAVKPGFRAELLPHLQALAGPLRGRLAAAVYDTPRAPSFSALSQLKSFLDPFFGRIDLRVADPAFQVDELPPNFASSVTLQLPAGSEAERLAAIARFMRDAAGYRRKRIWQGVTDVRTRRELNVGIEHAAPFLTGPAITELLEAPTDVVPCPVLHLPLHDWSARAEHIAASHVA